MNPCCKPAFRQAGSKVNATSSHFFILVHLPKRIWIILYNPQCKPACRRHGRKVNATRSHFIFPFTYQKFFLDVFGNKKVVCISKPLFCLVGMTGFEPATTRPPAECATGLRHIPKLDCKNIKVYQKCSTHCHSYFVKFNKYELGKKTYLVVR